MPPIGKQRHFEILRTALALAEERGSVAIDDAAAEAEASPEELRRILDPLLFLEFRTPDGTVVGEERAFFLTEDAHLQVTGDHWLRDLASEPPAPDAALRLLVAALTMQALATQPTPDLDDAIKKLRGIVAIELEVPVDRPPFLSTVEKARWDGRSVRFRYLAEGASAPRELAALPLRVFCKWGHWYLHGRLLEEHAPRYFRVDRMLDCAMGEERFDPPEHDAIPDWFDLSAHERTVRVRVAPEVVDILPQPHRVGETTHLGDGRVEVDVTVTGDRRLEHLLVCLPADADIVSPPEYNELRRKHARTLLAQYE